MTIIFSQLKNKRHYFFKLIAKNGRILLMSINFKSFSTCQKVVDSIQENSKNPNCFLLQNSKQKNFSYQIHDLQGRLLAQSPTYRSAAGRNRALRLVQTQLPKAFLSPNLITEHKK